MGTEQDRENRSRYEILAGLVSYINAVRKEQESMEAIDLVASWIERDLEIIGQF